MTDGKKTEADDMPKNPQKTESSGGIEDLMLEVAWKDYASAAEDKRALDTKANMILVASGVLLGLVINGFSLMDKAIGYIAIFVIMLSSMSCILALYMRPFKSLGIMSTWKALKQNNTLDNVPQAKLNIMATIDAAVNDKREQSKKIGKLIKAANILFMISIVLITASLFVFYFNSVCVCNIK